MVTFFPSFLYSCCLSIIVLLVFDTFVCFVLLGCCLFLLCGFLFVVCFWRVERNFHFLSGLFFLMDSSSSSNSNRNYRKERKCFI